MHGGNLKLLALNVELLTFTGTVIRAALAFRNSSLADALDLEQVFCMVLKINSGYFPKQ
jgi:hypothetical protein